MEGMGIFDAYDQEFNSLSRDIAKNISDIRSNTASNNDRAPNQVRLVEGLITQAHDLIKQMNLEVRSHDAATRKVLMEKVNHYQQSLGSLKADFSRAKEVSSRSSLIGDRSAGDRQRLLDTNDKLDRQNEMILNAQRTVAETEEVGIEITTELARNRETIERAHGKVRDFGGVTDGARRILTSMARRDVQQRFILAFIAAILFIAIVVTIYYSNKK
jgi:vesicle transport through interaction with t-SNAREs protein 1